MRNIVFEPQAFQDFNNWAREDKKVYVKIVGQGELLMSIALVTMLCIMKLLHDYGHRRY